jgi:hypothetical protein
LLNENIGSIINAAAKSIEAFQLLFLYWKKSNTAIDPIKAVNIYSQELCICKIPTKIILMTIIIVFGIRA